MSGIASAFSDGLILPAASLALLGWVVPRLLAFRFPEGARALVGIALLSAVILLICGMGFFVLLSLWQGVPVAILFEGGIVTGLVYWGKLGLITALLWGPMMLWSVARLPKNWVGVSS